MGEYGKTMGKPQENGELPSGNLTEPWKIAIEIVSFAIKKGDVPCFCKRLPEGEISKAQNIPLFKTILNNGNGMG